MEFIYKIAIDGDQEYLDNILEELRKDKGKKFDDIIWWYDKAYFNSVGFVAVPLKWKGDKFLVHFVNDGERFFFQRDVIHYGAKAILNRAEKDEIYKVMDEIQQYYHNPKVLKENIEEKMEKVPIEDYVIVDNEHVDMDEEIKKIPIENYVEIKDIFNIHEEDDIKEEEYVDIQEKKEYKNIKENEYVNIEERREKVINDLAKIINDLQKHNEDLEVKMEKRIKRIPIDEYPQVGEFFKNIKERNAPQVDYINNLLNEINPDKKNAKAI